MARGKWYVVTVGTDIGVFSRWLDAGPLVKGIPEALYESYTTFEEASMVFAREQELGRTRIVGRANGRSTMSTHSNARSPRNDSSQQLSFANNECQCHRNCKLGPAQPSSPTIRASTTPQYGKAHSAISRSSSEPSAVLRRFQVIDALFNDEFADGGVKARASSSSDTLALTPTFNTKTHSPSKTGNGAPMRAVVQTPSWVPQYPRAIPQSSDVLSPLNNANLALKSFQETIPVSRVEEASTSYKNLNTPASSLYISPASTTQTGKRTGKQAVATDPRSPLDPRVKVQGSLSNSFLLERQSPSLNCTHLKLNV